jgi:pSer/pThr/pTyr-binding forkhead associated (FHA) protein
MGIRLVSLDGGKDIAVDGGVTLIGRHPECDARLDGPRVSKRHCCLLRTGDLVEVRDLGSTNGTRLNGRRIVTGRLRPGDELAIAQFRFRLVHTHGLDSTLFDTAQRLLAISGTPPPERDPSDETDATRFGDA